MSGAVCILASLFLVIELCKAPLIGDAEVNTLAYGRLAFFGIVALTSATASIRLHRSSNLDVTRHPSLRLRLVEGILFTLVGGIVMTGGFLWLQMSGGFMGLHLIGFLLGGGLLLLGLRRLGRRL
ncbi:MAG: hypothetical protein KF833_11825 [Verrucomicrobiae bacterium]|nr:hypothetical protein [Verrucomicrobiae bacterium]